MSILKKQPEVQQEQQVEVVVSEANAIVVDTAQQAGQAKEFDQRCAGLIKEIEGHHKPIIDSINGSLKQARAKRDELLAPLKQARQKVQETLSTWLQAEQRREQEEKNRNEQARIAKEQELRKRAEVIIAGIVETQNTTAQKIADMEEQLESADDATAAVLRSAIAGLEHAEETGASLVDSINNNIQAEVAASSEVVQRAEKVSGVVGRTSYSVEVVSMQELCRAIGEGKVPVGCVTPAKGALNSLAKALQGGNIPGCQISKTIKAHTRK